MADLIEIMNKTKNVLHGLGYDALAAEIEHALISPELRIKVPMGELVVGVSDIAEASQAYCCLDNTSLGLRDLFLAECVNEELREEGEEEGDIRLRVWEDIGNEDYTRAANITAKEIEEQVKIVEGEDYE